jgi:hypothetical protein
MGDATRINAQVWSDIHPAGHGDLEYPNDEPSRGSFSIACGRMHAGARYFV